MIFRSLEIGSVVGFMVGDDTGRDSPNHRGDTYHPGRQDLDQ